MSTSTSIFVSISLKVRCCPICKSKKYKEFAENRLESLEVVICEDCGVLYSRAEEVNTPYKQKTLE